MIAASIVSAVFVLIIALMFVNVKVYFEYKDDILLYLKVLFIKFPIIYDKLPKQSMSLSELKRKERKAAKKAAKEEKKKKKKGAKKEPDEKEQKKEEKTSMLDKAKNILHLIEDFSGLVLTLLKDFGSELHIKIKALNVNVSCESVSDTALMYTAISQAMNALFYIIDDYKIGKIDYDNVSCNCDYLSGKFQADLSIVVKVRIGTIIRLALWAMYNYYKIKLKREVKNGQ